MPCNSDYLEPSRREVELRRAANLLIYVNDKTGVESDAGLKAAADDCYCKADYVPALCARLKSLSSSEMDTIVYDGRNRYARDLANWWDEHQRADEIREAKEKRVAELASLRQSGLAKLSYSERVALGISTTNEDEDEEDL